MKIKTLHRASAPMIRLVMIASNSHSIAQVSGIKVGNSLEEEEEVWAVGDMRSGGAVHSMQLGNKVQVIAAQCIAIDIPQLKGESIIKSNKIVTFTANAIYGIITFLLLLFPKEMLAFDPIYQQIMITYFGFSACMLLVPSILSFTEITVEF